LLVSEPERRLYKADASDVFSHMTKYEAFVESTWREHGLASVVIARIKDGNAEIGSFMVDWWCLGVKDAVFIDDAMESELPELVARQMPRGHERLHPACAKKLIEGAIAYAAKLGFAPHRDFRKARRVLSGLDSAACPETFQYGKNGRACYVEGPHDTPERVNKVLALLEARLGPDGYDFSGYHDDDGEDEEHASDVLYDFIAKHPAPAFGTHAEFNGLIASLQVCPRLVKLGQVLALFLHPGHPVWETQEEAQEVIQCFAIYWRRANELLQDAEARGAGSYLIDLHENDERELLEPAFARWCRGFMQSLSLWPEAWEGAQQRSELKPHFDVLRAWAEAGQSPENKPYPNDINAEDTISDAVIALYRALEPDRMRDNGVGESPQT
jgi:yecA family protein